MRRVIERWEAGLVALIRDRYRCTPDEAVQIRGRFADWQADALGVAIRLDADDKPVMTDELLAVLDACAHPEWAEQAAQQAAETLRLSNLKARTLASTIGSGGLACPHCHQHTRDIRFVEPSHSEWLYFICGECGRSFVPADLDGA